MKVLAIGASGFTGSHVVRVLVEQGHEVVVLHRGNTNAALPVDVRQVLGNRDRLENYRAEFGRFAPDVVLDFILYTEQQAKAAVTAFHGMAGRVVGISSADVYRNYDGFRRKATDPPDPVPLAEDAPLRVTRYPYRGSGVPARGPTATGSDPAAEVFSRANLSGYIPHRQDW